MQRRSCSDFIANAKRYVSRRRLVLVRVVALFDEGGGAEDVVSRGFSAGGLDGDAHGQALPFGRLTDRNEVVRLRPSADLLLDHGAASSKLGDNGEEASASRGGDAAVGSIVAKPDGIGDFGIEVGKVQGGDVSGGAIDPEPGAGLPDPARRGVGGESIVEAQGTTDGEGAVGDVMNLAGGPLFLAVVDIERADAQRGGLVRLGFGGSVGRDVRDAAVRAKGDGVDFGSSEERKCEQSQREKQEEMFTADV